MMIAAPGAGKVINVFTMIYYRDLAVAYGAAASTSLFYSGALTTPLVEASSPSAATGVRSQRRVFVSSSNDTTGAIGINEPVVFKTASNLTGGDAANVHKVWIAYSIQSVP